jgi:hypothetical protein
VFQNNQNKQKTNRNSSKFVKISSVLIPHTIISVCFSCFDSGPKHQNNLKQTKNNFFGFVKKQTKKQTKQIEFRFALVQTEKKINGFEEPQIEKVFWRFFRFVSRKFCLVRLF